MGARAPPSKKKERERERERRIERGGGTDNKVDHLNNKRICYRSKSTGMYEEEWLSAVGCTRSRRFGGGGVGGAPRPATQRERERDFFFL